MKKINLNKLFMKSSYIIYLILLKPSMLSKNPILNQFINNMMIVITLLLLFFFLLDKNKSKIMILLTLFFSSLLLSTIFNGLSVYYFFKNYLPMYGIAVYTEKLIKIDKDEALNKLSNFISMLIVINFISILILPHNSIHMSERQFFLGYDNSLAPIILLGCCIVLMNSYYRYEKLSFISVIILICTILSCFLVYSSTAKVGASLLILFIYIIHLNKDKIYRLFNYNLFWIASLAMFIGVIIFKVQNYFSNIIVNVLHRDLTFTGRTYIWDIALSYIKKSPIIGYGVNDPNITRINMGIFHAHNTYLNILFLGGIITLSLYVLILIVTGKNFKKENEKKFSYILSAAICIYFIISINEYYVKNHIFYIIIILSNYIPFYIKNRKEVE